VRWVDGQLELITLAEGVSSSYTFPSPYCGAFTDDGELIALSSENEADLQIIHWRSGVTLFETPWQSDWKPCDIVFTYDDITVTVLQETSDLIYSINYLSQTVVGPEVLTGQPRPFEALPEVLTNHWVEFSPTLRYALYARCTNGEISESVFPDEFYCTTTTDWVIYDLTREQQLYDFPLMDDEGLRALPRISLTGVSWSPDERFLAYLRPFSYSVFIFPLTIFDNTTGSLLALPDFSTIEIATELGIHWSPDSQRVAVWTRGKPYREPSSIPNETTLVIYDLVSQSFWSTPDKIE
jgi:WD40 repeat protein